MAVECSKCHTQNTENSRFCNKCATPLPSPEEISAFSTKMFEKITAKLARGTVFADRFEIIEELGKGGMGNVYRVVDTKIDEDSPSSILRELQRIEEGLSSTERIIHKKKTTVLKRKGTVFWSDWLKQEMLYIERSNLNPICLKQC